ncbi:molybdopterin-dependent oxidoreductase [Deltaproteobacteria bacterium TL4]
MTQQTEINRRKFVKLSALAGGLAASGILASCTKKGDISPAPSKVESASALSDGSLAGKLVMGGKDISPTTQKERKAIPTACWQCVARDAAIGYVEDGRIVKLEGNPESLRTNGKLCARGQGGIGQVYNPDRLLYPMKHVGSERGDGQWKRISWDEAYEIMVSKLKPLMDSGHPEKIMFHYGRMKGSSSPIINDFFFKTTVGTKTIEGHTSICEGGKWTAQELTWGNHYDINDVAHTNFILNFGCNFFETHTSHIPFSQRVVKAQTRGVKIVTFDVRLSNTAARSDEWIPVKPGTDGAVVLAMCHVIMKNNLHDADYIEKWTNATVDELKTHLAQYTPEWAEGISGVSASKIKALALEFAKAKPATVVSYRGVAAHYNVVQSERAMFLLEAICGYLNRKGGRNKAVGGKWKNSYKPVDGVKGLKVNKGDGLAYPTHGVCQQVLPLIKDGKFGRPDVYITYCYNPTYVNGDCGGNIAIMKDKSLIPFIIASDVSYGEGTSLADLILPDATYLERWNWDDMVSYDQVPEFYIRQALIKPLGEAVDFSNVGIELAKRLGKPLPFSSAEEFVKNACENTPEIKAVGGFEYMVQHGAWHDKNAKPKYSSHEKVISGDALKDVKYTPAGRKGEQVVYTGDIYDDKHYVGVKVGDVVYEGFKPDKIARKTGLLSLYSDELKDKGFDPLPSWMPIPDHQDIQENELVMTTYKVRVQTHSRTQNCKLLSELYHDNPVWINTQTANRLGIQNGGKVKLTSKVLGVSKEYDVRVTEEVVPGVVAISHHCGHWQHGEYASGKSAAYRDNVNTPSEGWNDVKDVDLKLKWWKKNGEHPNWLMPNDSDPIAGQMRFMDHVVQVMPL